jgi:hypothetical protein
MDKIKAKILIKDLQVSVEEKLSDSKAVKIVGGCTDVPHTYRGNR